MHFDRILFNVELYDNDFLFSFFFLFFTVSVNVPCFHVTYGSAVKGPVSSSCWLLPARALTYQQKLRQCSRSAGRSVELTRKQCNVVKITDVLPSVSHSNKNRFRYFRLKPSSGRFPRRMRSSVRSSAEKENILRTSSV